MEIREATIADVENIRRLNAVVQKVHADALPEHFKPVSSETFPVSEIEAQINSEISFIALAVEQNVACGYVLVERMKRAENGLRYAQHVFYVHHIAVLPEFQGRDIGQALLEHVKQCARDEGASSVALDVWSFNESAKGFFRSSGFETFNEKMWIHL